MLVESRSVPSPECKCCLWTMMVSPPFSVYPMYLSINPSGHPTATLSYPDFFDYLFYLAPICLSISPFSLSPIGLRTRIYTNPSFYVSSDSFLSMPLPSLLPPPPTHIITTSTHHSPCPLFPSSNQCQLHAEADQG